jgi:hypothetical protein
MVEPDQNIMQCGHSCNELSEHQISGRKSGIRKLGNQEIREVRKIGNQEIREVRKLGKSGN